MNDVRQSDSYPGVDCDAFELLRCRVEGVIRGHRAVAREDNGAGAEVERPHIMCPIPVESDCAVVCREHTITPDGQARRLRDVPREGCVSVQCGSSYAALYC